jgi:hypothetical protein
MTKTLSGLFFAPSLPGRLLYPASSPISSTIPRARNKKLLMPKRSQGQRADALQARDLFILDAVPKLKTPDTIARIETQLQEERTEIQSDPHYSPKLTRPPFCPARALLR